MIYNYHDLNVSYIRIPKTGSRSIMHALLPRARSGDKAHYKSFVVIRNPYSRLTSALAMFSKPSMKYRFFRCRKPFGDLTFEKAFEILEDGGLKVGAMTQRSFIKLHLIPMTHAQFGAPQADRIFRFEQLAEQWDEIADYIGVPHAPIVHKGGGNKHITLTPEQRERVYEYFKADFEAFEYPK